MVEKKTKLGFKDVIQTTAFIGFILSFLFFMWMYQTENMQDFKIVLTIWCVFWLIMMVFGFNKGSIMAFGAALIKIATDKTLTNTDKIALIMITIQEWANIAANIAMMENIKKEADNPKKKIEKIE